MPTKIGGGNKPEEYDPSTGRYGYGSGRTSEIYKRARMDLNSDNVKYMPCSFYATTPDEKFLDYSLNLNHPIGYHKAVKYYLELGYTKNNYKELKRQIHRAIVNNSAKLIKVTENSHNVVKYTFEIDVIGANSKKGTVIAVYGIRKNSSRPFMITNYVKKG